MTKSITLSRESLKESTSSTSLPRNLRKEKSQLDHGADESLVMIGGDSTNTNTGWSGVTGSSSLMDGPITPRSGFSGPIGKIFERVNFNFKQVKGTEDIIELPVKIVKSLSTDQHNCYLLIKAIKSGSLSPQLAGLKCGPLNQSRWLTTAQAILLLWTREHGLKGEVLRRLEEPVKFCLNFFKMYYDIKVKHHLKFGPEHVVSSLRLLRNQTPNVRNIISAAAHHAHPQNILVSFLCSVDEHQRDFDVRQIEKIREGRDFGDNTVRPHKNPKVILQAASPGDLVNWE
ncbi:hypothetical protein Hamer_G002281 [Homarus americanus]|uniref:Uncharacterized protein n=1 Tax=Homarus americanus TaxID=6706 RepID=A0A8J5JS45_HOMAM|nr:hypothetical protein Hamer_G002281 [Homarus americanus]